MNRQTSKTSFVFGAVVLMKASTSSAVGAMVYLTVSLIVGYAAVWMGMRIGARGAA